MKSAGQHGSAVGIPALPPRYATIGRIGDLGFAGFRINFKNRNLWLQRLTEITFR